MWASLGRRVITNLTTVTDSARGFTTLMLGRYFAGRLIEDGKVPREDALDVFLRMEQIAGYVRYAAHGSEQAIRGVERVKKNIDEGNGRVWIGTDRKGMILSDQKTYGLWGLYTVAARTSRLIPEGPTGVSDEARELIEKSYLPKLEGGLPSLLRLLERGGYFTAKQSEPLFSGLAKILAPRFTGAELDLYGRNLRDGLVPGASPDGRQQRFRVLLEEVTDLDAPLSRQEIVRLAERARKKDATLARSLERIVHLESLLAPADVAFDFLLTQSGQSPEDAAERLRESWGTRVPNLDREAFDDLLPELREATSPQIVALARRCHVALAAGAYREALAALADWNGRVMADRRAAPWVRIGENGRIDVRYRGAERLLPKEEEVATLWRYDYFVGSLKRVTRELRDAA